MHWLILLALQAPAIEEVRSVDIGSAECTFLQTSQTGKWLLLGRPEKLEVYSTADLQRTRQFELPWTTAGFDEDDAHLIVVGRELLRFSPKDWKEVSRDALKDSEILEPKIRVRPGNSLVPRQAWIYPDGSVLYRSLKGGVRQADWDAGKLVTREILPSEDDPDFPVQGIIGMTPQSLIVDRGSVAGVLSGTRVFRLIASTRTFFAESCGGATVLVGENFESTYNSRSWRIMALRTEEETEAPLRNMRSETSMEGKRYAAAIDHKSGWVLIAGEKGLRSWNPNDFSKVERYAGVGSACRQLAIDSSQRLLYTLETEKLRCWRIKD